VRTATTKKKELSSLASMMANTVYGNNSKRYDNGSVSKEEQETYGCQPIQNREQVSLTINGGAIAPSRSKISVSSACPLASRR